MRTVVTGGSGFIGSHLVKALQDAGREVAIATDEFAPGNLTTLGINLSGVEIRRVDLSSYSQASCALEGMESVFHLAARIGGLTYLHGNEAIELHTLQTNLFIDANVLRACVECGVKKIVYASSCAVYPMDQQYAPGAVFSEDDRNAPASGGSSPDGGYGWAKLVGEVQLHWLKGVGVGIARIFNVYGENEPLGEKAHVVADLLSKAVAYPERPFTVHGTGEQTRDFLYVSDCVDALIRLEERAIWPPLTVNIGSGVATSIASLAARIVEISGKRMNVIFEPSKSAGPLSRSADITRARRCLNWNPRVSLDDGLRRTYRWVERKLGESS